MLWVVLDGLANNYPLRVIIAAPASRKVLCFFQLFARPSDALAALPPFHPHLQATAEEGRQGLGDMQLSPARGFPVARLVTSIVEMYGPGAVRCS